MSPKTNINSIQYTLPIFNHVHITNAHIKRPSNSFMIWSRDMRSEISKTNPNKSNSEISQILGQQWQNMSNESKLKYKLMANQIQLEHIIKYPNYKYTPKIGNRKMESKKENLGQIGKQKFKNKIKVKSKSPQTIQEFD